MGSTVGAARGEVASAAVGVGGVGECGGEEAVGPVFGVAAGVGEDEVDFGVADLEPGELVGEPVAVDVFQLEERAYLASTTRAASGSSANRCSWKASVPSEKIG